MWRMKFKIFANVYFFKKKYNDKFLKFTFKYIYKIWDNNFF